MSKWKWDSKPLSELCTKVGDGIHATPNYVDESEYFFINGNNLESGFITITENTKKVSFEEYEKHYVELNEKSLLMSINGTLGSLALYRGEPVMLGKSAAYINCNSINRVFCYYYLQLNYIQQKLYNEATGSTIKNLSLESLKNLHIPVPPENEQNKIATILSALDSKIELNIRINAELESMAKTLYDYWIVQFDFPDAQGKPYKTSGGKMVWNEELKREIPDGWKAGKLSDIANITMGQSPPGESYNETGEGVVFYQGCTDFGIRFPSVRLYTKEPSRFAKAGDILLSVRAPVGMLNIANEDCCIGRGLAALRTKLNSNAFLFEVLKELKTIFNRRNVDGTTFGSITKDDLFSLKVVVPKKELIEFYQCKVESAYEKQNKIELENKELTELRDWLLPMLMNRQVRVG